MHANVMKVSGKAVRRAALRAVWIVLAGLTLTACDKCGNSIFRADAGPLACRDQGSR